MRISIIFFPKYHYDIKSRVGWVWHVACKEMKRSSYVCRTPESESYFGRLGIDGRLWIGFIWLRVGRSQWWCLL
jgi:hypothetical protein